jgi:hypothetical protein
VWYAPIMALPAPIEELRTAVTWLAGVLFVGFIGANVRHLASAKGFDNLLTRGWDYVAARSPEAFGVAWREKWWFWLLLGASSALAIALWLVPSTPVQNFGPVLVAEGPAPNPSPSMPIYMTNLSIGYSNREADPIIAVGVYAITTERLRVFVDYAANFFDNQPMLPSGRIPIATLADL